MIYKAELVEEGANQTGLTRKTSREAVDAIISVITDSRAREEQVTLVDFGTFQVMRRGRKLLKYLINLAKCSEILVGT